jgi:peptide-methionine (S)-S-oxide reductase
LFSLGLFASAAGQGSAPQKTATATFAGGCFWCVEADFDKVEGVISTTSGYTGGHAANPSYEEVSRGGTGHAEAVEIVYDPAKVSYEKLLDVFWHNIDPLAKDRQFCDHGETLQAAYCDRDRAGRPVLQSRRVPSGILREESHPLQILPLQLRTRCPARRAVGQEGLGPWWIVVCC